MHDTYLLTWLGLRRAVILTDILSQSYKQVLNKNNYVSEITKKDTRCNKNNTHTITFFAIRSMNLNLHLRSFQRTLFTLLNNLRQNGVNQRNAFNVPLRTVLDIKSYQSVTNQCLKRFEENNYVQKMRTRNTKITGKL